MTPNWLLGYMLVFIVKEVLRVT